MKQRGRKSEAQLSVPEIKPLERPDPPECLKEEEAEEWRTVVGRLPADWFKAEHFAMLENYCRLVAECRSGISGAELDKASRAVLAHARSLRLTHQSQTHPETAGRGADRAARASRPWEN